MVEVVVSRLGLDSTKTQYVVVLQEKNGQRLLPIWIGEPEAESIVFQVKNVTRPRPITHDLCRSLILGLGGSLQRVHITRVENNIYYAEMHIRGEGGVVQIDARPSDSIAIALRFSAPIFADESLLTLYDEEESEPAEAEASEAEPLGLPESHILSADELQAYLEKLRPEDLGEFNL